MPASLNNGKICYIELPAMDIAQSVAFYKKSSGGIRASGVTVTPRSMTARDKSVALGF